jgi:hypothetical protein
MTSAYVPKVLQDKLAQEGCFYNSAEDRYQISGVDFGRELSETVADLGLKGWYTKDRLETYKDLYNGSNYTTPDLLTVSVFDAKYEFFVYLSDYKCYRTRFYASITSDSKTAYPYENIMDYDDACTYFYNLYDKFVASYGEPDVREFPVDLNDVTLDYFTGKNSYYPEVNAYWLTGEEGHQSLLRLHARTTYTEDNESNRALVMSVYIDVGQEMEGVNLDDLLNF